MAKLRTKLFRTGTLCIFIGSQCLSFFAYAQETTPPEETKKETCAACGGTPASMQHFIDFTTEVLNTIKTVNPKPPQLGEYAKPSGLFTAGPFDTIATDEEKGGALNAMYQATKKNFQQKWQGLLATTLIFTHLASANIGMGRAIIFKSAGIIRDWKKLQDLDKQISDKLYQLGLGGAYFDKIDPKHIQALQQIMEKYSGEAKLFEDKKAIIGSSATYGQLVRLLRKLNARHKSVLALPLIMDPFEIDEEIKEITKGDITIEFGSEYGKKMLEEYECTKLIGACSDAFKQFGESMKLIGGDFATAAKDSGKQIKNSVIRLQKALQGIGSRKQKIATTCDRAFNIRLGQEERTKKDPSTKEVTSIRYIKPRGGKAARREKEINGQVSTISETEAYKECKFTTREMGLDETSKEQTQEFLQREQELLATQFGLHVKDATLEKSVRGQGAKLIEKIQGSLQSQEEGQKTDSFIKKTGKKIGDAADAIGTKIDEFGNKIETMSAVKNIMSKNYAVDMSTKESLLAYENMITTTINTTIENHVQSLNEAAKADPRDIIRAIGAMIQKIRYTRYLIQDNNNPKSLINNLGKACEGQCNNAGGTCWSE